MSLTPPAEYWTHIPWWAFIGLTMFLALISSPFLIKVMQGKQNASLQRETLLIAEQARLTAERERISAELQASVTRLNGELDAMRGSRELERVRCAAERSTMQRDIDNGWSRGRGMTDRAHFYKHAYDNLAQNLLSILSRLGDRLNNTPLEPEDIAQARLMIAQAPKPATLPAVPDLESVERREA